MEKFSRLLLAPLAERQRPRPDRLFLLFVHYGLAGLIENHRCRPARPPPLIPRRPRKPDVTEQGAALICRPAWPRGPAGASSGPAIARTATPVEPVGEPGED